MVFLALLFEMACNRTPRTFTINVVADRHCALTAALEVVNTQSDQASVHGVFLHLRATRVFEEIEQAVATNAADAALVPGSQAVLLLGANPDWRLYGDLGPTRRLVALAAKGSIPTAGINFAGRDGHLVWELWGDTVRRVAGKPLRLNDPPPHIKPQYLTAASNLLVIPEPLSPDLVARTNLSEYAALEEHLFLLVRRSYVLQHKKLLAGFLQLLCNLPLQSIGDRDPFLGRIADTLLADPAWARSQMIKIKLNGANAAACRDSMAVSDETRKGLLSLVEAGKRAKLIRQGFMLGPAIW